MFCQIQKCVAACAVVSFSAILVIQTPLAWADVFADRPSHGAREVELFSAMAEKEVDVVMIPRDARRVTLQVKNNTDQPLAIRLPHAFAGVPVLAQVGGFGAPGGGGGGMAAPQGLGMGFPGGGGNAGMFGGPGGLMNVPPGKVIKVKRQSVCLEYSKPEPGPRIAYRVVPLEEMSDHPALRELLTVMAHDQLDQRVAQIAAWHFANGMSWEKLASLRVKHINGRHSPRFTAQQIRAAQLLAAALPSQQKKNARSQRENGSSR